MHKMNPLIAAIMLIFFVLAGMAIADEKAGPAELILKSTVDPAKKSKPAFFPHGVHQGHFECARCHHSEGGINIAKCETCHNKAAKATGMPPKLDTFKKVSHELCKGCHKERKKEGKKAGPTKCNGCHRKGLK